jgi:hypothetical protein
MRLPGEFAGFAGKSRLKNGSIRDRDQKAARKPSNVSIT